MRSRVQVSLSLRTNRQLLIRPAFQCRPDCFDTDSVLFGRAEPRPAVQALRGFERISAAGTGRRRSGEVTRSFVDAGLQRIDQHEVIALEILIQIAGKRAPSMIRRRLRCGGSSRSTAYRRYARRAKRSGNPPSSRTGRSRFRSTTARSVPGIRSSVAGAA